MNTPTITELKAAQKDKKIAKLHKKVMKMTQKIEKEKPHEKDD